MDYVDPAYNFVRDDFGSARRKGDTDRYAHQMLTPAPYDGLLVSMSAVKDGRYSQAAQQRLLRDGVRKFLNFEGPQFADKVMMGDCGAFAYAAQEKPPYSIDELIDFYSYGGFTHGCALDHVIFHFDAENPRDPPDETADFRYALTLENAREFLAQARRQNVGFHPIGVVQGWSPASMAHAAATLVKMGYTYLAVGGLVPLNAEQIHRTVSAVRASAPNVALHLLGFAKAESIREFIQYGIASFDSTSPLIRAFRDAKANYYMPGENGLKYYMALRVPQALENAKLMRSIKRGKASPEQLLKAEAKALAALREYEADTCSADVAYESLEAYLRQFYTAIEESPEAAENKLNKLRPMMLETLVDRPWKKCKCAICRQAGIEVMIFRASNRNKRRGMHNLGVFHNYLKQIL